MLDDVKAISAIDQSGMLDLLERFPDNIRDTINFLENISLPSLFKIDNIIISGMGSSAISGDIIQSLLWDKLDIPIFVSRQCDLPKWANKNSLILSLSYSGNTEETLRVFKLAHQRHCQIIGISSGGKLLEYCQHRNTPHISVPAGLPPRAGTAYILFSSLISLEKVGLLRYDLKSEIDETISIVENLISENKKIIPEANNISKQIAKKLLNTTPHIYGWGIYSPTAKRWRTQLNENSKVIAQYDEVPECTHNEIEGWAMNPEVTKTCSNVIIRDDKEESIYMSKKLNFLKELYEAVSATVIEVNVKGKKRLAKMMYAMTIGDFVSCYLAILRNIDPTPVKVIIQLKNELSKI